MTSTAEQDYYVGILPKPPQASRELLDLLVKKFRAFRLQALSEHDGLAFGRSEWSYENTRTIDSYYKDLTSSRDFWVACFVAPAGLDGNNFRNVSNFPLESTSHTPAPSVDANDERIVEEGTWIALSSGHGPFTSEEWHLKQLQGTTFPDEVESRFHLANLYFLEDYRGAKDANRERMFKRMIMTTFDYFERLAYSLSTRKPAYCRLRGTITPAAIGTKLMSIYEGFGYHIIGWVPQVTAMIVNGAKVGSWPKVEEEPGFYADCKFPTFEKLSRIDEDGVVLVLTEATKRGEVWSRL